MDCRWSLLRDGYGQPKGFLQIETDISERKKVEQQFLRAQRMESIGTLAGGIAHDLNNVLGPIMMGIEVLKINCPDTESQHLLGLIGISAQRGADMVSQVLSFARGVEGKRMEVQVHHLVTDIVQIANDTFLKHIEITNHFPQKLWSVQGDPTQLHQVLLNLCVNARDAMPNGGRLSITAENIRLDEHYAAMETEAKAGPYILLQVEDTGSGIPPGIIEKIFDPFFTTKEIGKGTGLGLSTTMAIIKSHGGFLRVYSELGKGTKFKVHLPADPDSSDVTVEDAKAKLPRGNGELILIIDDESTVRQVTQQTLEAFGYRTVIASDGPEAVVIYARRGDEVAVVLTDMMMPGMDGYATIQALKKMNPSVRIIAASGLALNEHVARAANLGVTDFLPKPFRAEKLLNTLSQILKRN
jgi:nitrogen-specific signal transduction histidine kinase/CheY-like chemotaxis protein